MVRTRLEQTFSEAGVVGYVHAREVGISAPWPEVDLRADERVVLASVFKVAVAVAFACAVEQGRLDPAMPAVVTREYRRGGSGFGGFEHDATAALGDLAELMMTLSDNAATDVIIDAVGMPAVQQVIDDLRLADTAIAGRTIDDLAREEQELRAMGVPGLSDAPKDPFAEVPAEMLLKLSTVDPGTALTYSTPQDMTELLDAIWTDRSGPPAACAAVRATMSRQVWSHRLSAGFDSTYQVSGKTGTLEGIRNEVGVVTTPEGRSFAVAVFTRSPDPAAHNPAHDTVIGAAARICVDHLSSTSRAKERGRYAPA